MAVKLRLRRLGRKKRPIYGVVAADSRSPRDGRYIEDLGRYSPVSEPAEIKLERDRILYWLGQGAQPSDTVKSLLSSEGILLAHSLKSNGASSEDIDAAVETHRAARLLKTASSGKKTTMQDRVKAALEAEKVSAAAKAAEYAKARAEAEALAKAEADAAKAKAEAEVEAQRASAATVAKEEQEEKNEAQTEADTSAKPAAEAPVAEAPVAEAPKAETSEAEPSADSDKSEKA